MLVGYTDGVSEAQNPADDEFGEDNVVSTVLASRDLSSRELVDRLLGAADAFAAGPPQYDDMTVVVLRELSE